MRTVILHYHLFKNAGTSLDAAFKDNFNENDEWVTKEFPSQFAQNREQVKQWIIDNPQAKCFSSHTVIFPTPKIEGVKIIPVIFYRHPFDRIVSAYTFEKKQGGDGFGPVLARHTELEGYIATRLSLQHDRQCRNFHVQRLATMFNEKQWDEETRAKMAVEQLPFVGLVERYSESLERLELLLEKEGFNNIKLKPLEQNVSRSMTKTLDDKLIEVQSQLGEDLFEKLLDANSLDLSIWKGLIKAAE